MMTINWAGYVRQTRALTVPLCSDYVQTVPSSTRPPLRQRPPLTFTVFGASASNDPNLLKYAISAGAPCAYCGKKLVKFDSEVDHIRPKALNGADDRSNYVVVCHRCNFEKGDTPLKTLLAAQSRREQDDFWHNVIKYLRLMTDFPQDPAYVQNVLPTLAKEAGKDLNTLTNAINSMFDLIA